MINSIIVSLLYSLPSLANPSPDVIQMVKQALAPGVTAQESEPTRGNSCDEMNVTLTGADPITHQPRNVSVHVYTPSNPPQKMNDVLIFPPIGGENFIDRHYAESLCDENIRAVILNDWDHSGFEEPDLDVYNRAGLRTLAAAEHTIEYLKPQGTVGILGTSLGGIYGAFVLGYDARVTSAVLIVAGDNLPNIIAHSEQKTVAEWREKQMEINHISSVDEFEAALQKIVKLEPSTFVGYSGAKKLEMFSALDDTYVPTPDQMLLQKAEGNPKVINLDGGHKEVIFDTYMNHSSEVVDFLKSSL